MSVQVAVLEGMTASQRHRARKRGEDVPKLPRGGTVKHGHCTHTGSSPTYKSWHMMIQRCLNVKTPKFYNYGGRGIRVHIPWIESFANFLQDMGERPAGKTLDRYPNNNGNYEPGNCRWATPKEQRANQRKRSKANVG